jgi:hypothetical protein
MKTITENEWHTLSFKERDSYTGIIKWDNGDVCYYKNGFLHREDGPAVTNTQGYKSWYFEGRLHNLNGPARIWQDGVEEYWIDNKPTTKEAVDFLRDLYKIKKIRTKEV